MKILYVITKADHGGAQTYVSQLVCDQIARGNTARVVCGSEGDWLGSQIPVEIDRLPLERSWNPLKSLQFKKAFAQYMDEHDFDLVHFHSSHTFAGISIAKQKGVKTVVTVHGLSYFTDQGIKGKIYRPFLAKHLPLSDHVSFVCEKDRNVLFETIDLKKDKTSVVYTGVGEINFLHRDEARERLGLSQSTTVIGSLARYSYQKNLGLLIDAFARMSKRDAVLCLIGYGPDQEKLREQAKKLGIRDRVLFREGNAKVLRVLDVFVLTSRFEGFPYALLEAGAAGLPVVTVDVGGVCEIVDQGMSGVVVESNPGSVSEGIGTAINQKERLGPNLQKVVKERFSEKRLVDGMNEVYLQVTGGVAQ